MADSITIQRRRKTRDLCDEYQVAPVTLWRWVQSGKLPKPHKINGHNYWPADVEPIFDDEVHGGVA